MEFEYDDDLSLDDKPDFETEADADADEYEIGVSAGAGADGREGLKSCSKKLLRKDNYVMVPQTELYVTRFTQRTITVILRIGGY